MSLDDTVGLVIQLRESHGKCLNLEPIKGFTECRGQCASSTVFNASKFSTKRSKKRLKTQIS